MKKLTGVPPRGGRRGVFVWVPPRGGVLVGLALFGLWVGQLAYYGAVGYRTGMWDYYFTRAEYDRAASKADKASLPVAIDHLEKALRYARELPDPDGRLARTYHDLGTMWWAKGMFLPARHNLLRSRRIYVRTDGPRSYFVGIIDARLGEMDLDELRLADAETRLTSANGILLRVVGSYDSLCLRNLANLARLRDIQGRYLEALSITRQILPEVAQNGRVGDSIYRQKITMLSQRLEARHPKPLVGGQ